MYSTTTTVVEWWFFVWCFHWSFLLYQFCILFHFSNATHYVYCLCIVLSRISIATQLLIDLMWCIIIIITGNTTSSSSVKKIHDKNKTHHNYYYYHQIPWRREKVVSLPSHTSPKISGDLDPEHYRLCYYFYMRSRSRMSQWIVTQSTSAQESCWDTQQVETTLCLSISVQHYYSCCTKVYIFMVWDFSNFVAIWRDDYAMVWIWETTMLFPSLSSFLLLSPSSSSSPCLIDEESYTRAYSGVRFIFTRLSMYWFYDFSSVSHSVHIIHYALHYLQICGWTIKDSFLTTAKVL